MLYPVLLLAVLTIALIGLQRYSIGKIRRGFSLYESEKRDRFRFPDQEEETMRQWLESDGDDQLPLVDREHD